jgi:hypothetical protein
LSNKLIDNMHISLRNVYHTECRNYQLAYEKAVLFIQRRLGAFSQVLFVNELERLRKEAEMAYANVPVPSRQHLEKQKPHEYSETKKHKT